MSNQQFHFQLLNHLSLELDGNDIDLQSILGKQLSTLLALFICNHSRVLSKEMLMDEMWSDSENPSNALKYAIFRLRESLKKIEGLEDVTFVSTHKNGYQLNPDLDITLDIEEFESHVSKAKQTNDVKEYEQAIGLYKGDLLSGYDAYWVQLDRGYYRTMFLQVCNLVAAMYVDQNNSEKAIEVARRGLGINLYDEKLNYLYINALVMNRQYNLAMTYATDISSRYMKEFGVPLKYEGKSMSSILTSGYVIRNDSDIDVENKQLDVVEYQFGPMRADAQSFQLLTQYESRNNSRNHIKNSNKYVIDIEIISDDDIEDGVMSKLLEIISLSLRNNDVYAKKNRSHVMLFVTMAHEEDSDVIVGRIRSRLTKVNFKKNYQINYSLRNL